MTVDETKLRAIIKEAVDDAVEPAVKRAIDAALGPAVDAAVNRAVKAAVGPAIDQAIDRRNLASKQDVRDIVNHIIDSRNLATKDDVIQIVSQGIDTILPYFDAITTPFDAYLSRHDDDWSRANHRMAAIEQHVGLREKLEGSKLMADYYRTHKLP